MTPCISWAELTAGRWTVDWTDRPCAPAVLTAGRVWPAWREGSPPSWEDVLGCGDLSFADRRWIVARVLVSDRKLLVSWAADCAEISAPRAGKWEPEVRAVIADLRRWCADAVAAYAAYAAAYTADADAAAGAAQCLELALPYLERAMQIPRTW